MVTDEVWKLSAIVDRFLSYRAAIPLAQEQIGVMVSILRTREKPVETFLDLGCGDGILGAAILGAWPAARGLLVDFSEPMLEQAREQLKDYSGQLMFANLDYGDPTWVREIKDYARFDTIVSGYSIHHQPDERKREIYAEIFGLLNPGGWFVNIEHVSSAAQLNIDLFEHHYVSARYAMERQNGSMRTFEQIADQYKIDLTGLPTSWRPSSCNVTGCARSVMRKWIVTSASMSWPSSAGENQSKFRKSKIINRQLDSPYGSIYYPDFSFCGYPGL